MGKRDKKKKGGASKDPDKKAELQLRKEQKADRAARKRLEKDQRSASSSAAVEDGTDAPGGVKGGGDDIDSLLTSYRRRDEDLSTPVVEVLHGEGGACAFPSPRANFSLTLLPGSSGSGGGGCNDELLVFGGEYYDGAENVVYDELYRWDPDAASDDAGPEKGDSSEPASAVDDDGGGGTDGDDGGGGTGTSVGAGVGVWKRILCPQPRPPARCAHSAVFYRDAVYVFGGEVATSDQFHHHRDLWKFVPKTNAWEEIRPRSRDNPPPRSGHRCVVWRRYMVMFGGFYEAARETRWYDDLWVYDFAQNTWTECKFGPLASTPPARSAFAFGLAHPSSDTAIVYGGFSKVRNPGSKAEGKVHVDCWALHLKGLARGELPTWERLRGGGKGGGGECPSPRASPSSVTHGHRLLLYGGVKDDEGENHRVSSVFYDDLYAFDSDKRRWFALGLKRKKEKGRRRRRKKKGGDDDDGDGDEPSEDGDTEEEEEDDDDDDESEGEEEPSGAGTGWDLDRLRANMFAFIDGDGNIVYEKIEPDEDDDDDDGYHADGGEGGTEGGGRDERGGSDDDEEDKEEEKDEDEGRVDEQDEEREEGKEGSKGDGAGNGEKKASVPPRGKMAPPVPVVPPGGVASSEVMRLTGAGIPTAVDRSSPLPRIGAAAVVRKNVLYVYGGLLEVGDREVTLDDCWTLDLQRRERWNCVWRGSMHRQVWRGAGSDDDASYVSTADDANNADADGGNGYDEDGDDEAAAAPGESQRSRSGGGERKEKFKSGIRLEIDGLKRQLDLDDVDRTPQLGEELADFYARTSEYWNRRAVADESKPDGGEKEEERTEKELKRIGFGLARERYDELRPVLERLNELDSQQQSAEEKKEKKKKKKSERTQKERRRDRKR